MTEFIIPAEAPTLHELKTSRLDNLARRTIFSVMNKLKFGSSTLLRITKGMFSEKPTLPGRWKQPSSCITPGFTVAFC